MIRMKQSGTPVEITDWTDEGEVIVRTLTEHRNFHEITITELEFELPDTIEEQAKRFGVFRPDPVSVGNLQAFPVQDDERLRGEYGMTYRQWLIGKALATLDSTDTLEDTADNAIGLADAIIAKLDAEAPNADN